MRNFRVNKLAFALALSSSSALALAQNQAANALQVDVTGSREGGQSILTPTKILAGEELQNKLGASLGATLANELGVSATGYGSGASRPVIRGLDGPRVQILQNGISVGDVSNISADHAVASPIQNARQIEILRGAAALLYGSGSSGGLVNIVNDRILTNLPDATTGVINTSLESVNQGKAASLEVDTAIGSVALHLDTAVNNANNYAIPGNAEQGGPNANWAINPGEPVNVPYSGKLPFSFSNQNNLGLGASYIGNSGYSGISVERLNHNYGTPTSEGGFIQQSQNRYDFSHQTRDPFAGFSSFKFNAANINYLHTEYNNNGEAFTQWSNKANEARLELAHKEIAGWKGTVGVQFTGANLNATDLQSNNYAIVPPTKTNSNSLFWIEEGRFGALQTSLGARYNLVAQNPNLSTEFPTDIDFTSQNGSPSPTAPTLQNRKFNLFSYSAGGMWNLQGGYGLGMAFTVSQRAPSAQELFSYGPHDATATFDVGNSNLSTETSRNLEVNMQKTIGLLRGKASVYQNMFSNYIYGFYTGAYSPSNENFSVVQSSQANATIRGAEGELTYNWNQKGVAGRIFGDASYGTFNGGGQISGNLPLQPAPRMGLELAHRTGGWLTNATYIYGLQQTRLASFEIGPTPSYSLLNGGVSYTEKINKINWTAYMVLKNLLNQDIRYATTPMPVRLYAPQPGRSIMVGVKASF